MSQPIRVGIVGAGIAGLTAALRLAERGYTVTVYEEKPYVGGEFGAHTHDGGKTYHEHAYHMFLNWYHNFWALVADVGIDRREAFEPRHAIRVLRPGQFPRTAALREFASLEDAWANLFSGIVPIPDMFLYWYSLVDLLAEPFGDGLLGQYTVNGFMQSRPYASEGSAHMHGEVLTKAFASPSYLASARSYKSFIRYGARQPSPMLWVMRGNVHQRLHRSLVARLRALGVTIKLESPVRRMEVTARASRGRPVRAAAVTYDRTPYRWRCLAGPLSFHERPRLRPLASDGPPPEAPPASEPIDYLILAVPPHVLVAITGATPLGLAEAFTADIARIPLLHSEPMASMDLHFSERLPGIPREHVLLEGSPMGLSFVDNAQAWGEPHGTNLNVVAAKFGVAANVSPPLALEAMAVNLMHDYLPEFAHHVPEAHFQPNVGEALFINEVGSEQWRPGPQTKIPNVFLAGDYCWTSVDVVTVEAAVVSGLNAAAALQEQVARDERGSDELLEPIPVVRPEVYPDSSMMALKLLLAPYAGAAKGWSLVHEALRSATTGPPARTTVTTAVAEAVKLLWMPYGLAMDMWKMGLGLDVTPGAAARRTPPTSAPSTRSGTAARSRVRAGAGGTPAAAVLPRPRR
jgi:glycine/D-amino acid oxidase-like deaminating enzyme